MDLDFIWVDPDDGAVDVVKLVEFVPVLPSRRLAKIVISLVPVCDGGESWAGDLGKGVEV